MWRAPSARNSEHRRSKRSRRSSAQHTLICERVKCALPCTTESTVFCWLVACAPRILPLRIHILSCTLYLVQFICTVWSAPKWGEETGRGPRAGMRGAHARVHCAEVSDETLRSFSLPVLDPAHCTQNSAVVHALHSGENSIGSITDATTLASQPPHTSYQTSRQNSRQPCMCSTHIFLYVYIYCRIHYTKVYYARGICVVVCAGSCCCTRATRCRHNTHTHYNSLSPSCLRGLCGGHRAANRMKPPPRRRRHAEPTQHIVWYNVSQTNNLLTPVRSLSLSAPDARSWRRLCLVCIAFSF